MTAELRLLPAPEPPEAVVRGRVSRVLICKDVDAGGCWYFAANATSRKGHELAVNPSAALRYYGPQQGRQIRIRRPVSATVAERSAGGSPTS